MGSSQGLFRIFNLNLLNCFDKWSACNFWTEWICQTRPQLCRIPSIQWILESTLFTWWVSRASASCFPKIAAIYLFCALLGLFMFRLYIPRGVHPIWGMKQKYSS